MRPSVFAALTIALVCLPQGASGDPTSVTVTPADVSSLLLVAAAILRLLRGRLALPRRAVVLFGAVTVALAIASVHADDLSHGLVGFIRYSQVFVFVPLAMVIALRDRRDLALLGCTMIASGVFEGAVGVWQYATGSGATYAGTTVRAVGTFAATDVMGMSVVVSYALVVAVAGAVALGGRRRVALGAVAVFLLVPLIFSLSRGSWIAVVCAVVVVLALAGWRVLLITAVGAAAIGVLLVGGLGIGSATIGDRIASIGSSTAAPDSSVSDRYDLWATAEGIWRDHPVTGVGIKGFPQYRDAYSPIELSSGSDTYKAGGTYYREPLLSPHNFYLLVLSEQGIIGAVALFGWLLAMLVLALRRVRFPATAPWRWAGLTAVALIVWHLVDYAYSDIGGSTTVLTSAALGLVAWWAFPVRERTGPAVRVQSAPSTPVAATGPAPAGARAGATGARRLVRASAVSALLYGLGSLLGVGRDLLLAGLYGANGGTDAFLVAWTVPETAAPLLLDGALALVVVPAVAHALTRRDRPDAVRAVAEAMLPRICAVLAVVSAAIALGAPLLVGVLAPGLTEPALAVQCTRMVAISVLLVGVTGYLSAALRALDVVVTPAAIYVANNVGMILAILLLHRSLGLLSAAIGVVAGSVLMLGVLLPGYLRRVGLPRRIVLQSDVVTFGAFVPIVVYTLVRQAQTFVERFLASDLPPGTITYINYAQKIAQMPMMLALMIALVTFPAFARSADTDEADGARVRMETDLLVIGAVTLAATAFLVVFAEPVVALLFQRGEFTAADSVATADVIRVYVAGLLGQALVSALSRAFSTDRRRWWPVAAMAVGLVATAVIGGLVVGFWGAPGIALANAAGISISAVLLLVPFGGRRPAARASVLLGYARWLVPPTVVAVVAGTGLQHLLSGLPTIVTVLAGGIAIVAIFAAALAAMGRVRSRRVPAAGSAPTPPAAPLTQEVDR
ncbi:lipid II flippase MurJ [Pseudonocardia acidicola]|uniref:O-antigen ligase-related domain-containing protein n=1 Tax=Pseudonocardia acidicola TaxID=2724939 RepID=A0ABX1SEV7_9PSEU|nr:lipid II flippase MurJ [Pseudonocardia acidicola]NMI00089.1 hypothetical protein [Pseudonocardia acidicola]